MEFLKKIYCRLHQLFIIRSFVFRFDIYNGTEDANSIYVEDVYEYEFINQGTTRILINGGLYIYPEFAGIEPSRIKMDIDHQEKDETIYKYSFEPLDYMIGHTAATVDVPSVPVVIDNPVFRTNFNRLIVKYKLKTKVLDKTKNIQ